MNKNIFSLSKLFSVLISGLLFCASIQAEAIDPSPESTRLLASQCAQCHGTTGNSRGDFDSLAGEDFQALFSELLDMKESDDNKVMHKQIKAYTEPQLRSIADYYSRLPKNSTEEGVLPDSEGKDGEEVEDIELTETQKKALEAEKKKQEDEDENNK